MNVMVITYNRDLYALEEDLILKSYTYFEINHVFYWKQVIYNVYYKSLRNSISFNAYSNLLYLIFSQEFFHKNAVEYVFIDIPLELLTAKIHYFFHRI